MYYREQRLDIWPHHFKSRRQICNTVEKNLVGPELAQSWISNTVTVNYTEIFVASVHNPVWEGKNSWMAWGQQGMAVAIVHLLMSTYAAVSDQSENV